ncbi:MAG: sugar kinase [Thermofilum sp.]|nr:sugar kinase [Thermofilum sp.]
MSGVEVVCAGEILVDVIPREVGPYREGTLLEVHFGGAPANVAVGVARLGRRSAFVGSVGKDPFGDMLAEYLASEGVYTGWLARKDARTSLAFVVAKPQGERDFFFYRPPWVATADAMLEDGDVDWEAVRKVKVVHVSGVALSQPPLRDTVLKLMEVARSAGAHVSLDPNYRADIWLGGVERARLEFKNALQRSTVVMLGYDEMEPLLGTSDYREAAEKLLSMAPHLEYAAVRLGSRGAYVATRRGERVLVEAFKVPVVDTTGAGDAWAAGFIVFALLEGRSLHEAVLLSNAVAAVKCTRRGATAGMPKRSELRAFLEERGVRVEL